MLVLVYCLCCLSIFKIVIDIIWSELVAPYSVFLENIIFLIILLMIIRTYIKQREGRREMLQRKISDLNQALNEIK